MQREFLLLLAISALAKALPQNEVNNGSNSSTMEISKKYAPRFKHRNKMFNMDVKPAGSSIRLKCGADGNPMPNITWFKNSVPVEISEINSSKPIYWKWWLTLEDLKTTDNGNYTCLVCNELGCINHTVDLKVQVRLSSKPVITKVPVNQTIAVGETATFSCEFQLDFYPVVYWQFYKTCEELQNTLQNERNIVMSDNPDDKAETLTIHNVTQEHQGWYKCVAENILGASTGEGYLTVVKNDRHA